MVSPETAALSVADKESESARTARVLRGVTERGGTPSMYRARDDFKRPLQSEPQPQWQWHALHDAVRALRQARSRAPVSDKPPAHQCKVTEFFARKVERTQGPG